MRLIASLISIVSGILIASVAFLWFAAGEIYDYEDTFNVARDGGEVDVVLVLAGGKKRIPIAVSLWDQLRASRAEGGSPILFLSGVGPNAGVETLIDQGISKVVTAHFNNENVVFENVSENTFENAQIFASFARQKKWKQVVLVTAGYHMRRANFILKKILGNDIVIKTETVDAEHFDRNQWHQNAYAIRVTVIEYIKWLYYRYSY